MKSRSGKALLNTIAGFGVEIIAIVCGLILPRAILSAFGSSYNGITTSISQFISCIALMKAGVGGVTKVALYKPLAQHDSKKISEIVCETERFMRRISMFFIAFIAVFSVVYPLIINDEFEWFFSFSLVLIISISTFAQYYFGFSYQQVLVADQNQWICLAMEAVTYILNTTVSVILIKLGATIHIVKLGSALVFVIAPVFYNIFVKRKYNISKVQLSGSDHLKQRWDAVGHAVAEFINNNTDVMVITVFLNLLEVSVYSVYHLVMHGIKKVTNVFITGFGGAFGNMYAKEEFELMKTNLGIYEVVVFSIATVLYSTTLVMVLPFVSIYTKAVTDVEYIRPAFAAVITFAGLFGCFRIPYQTIVSAVGHYRQTRNGAFLEAIINIALSIALVFKLGIVGVAVGTLAAAVFRSIQYAVYLHKNIIKRSILPFVVHVFVSVSIVIIVYIASRFYLPANISILLWIAYACLTGSVSVLLTAVTDFIFFNASTKGMLRKVSALFRRRRKN